MPPPRIVLPQPIRAFMKAHRRNPELVSGITGAAVGVGMNAPTAKKKAKEQERLKTIESLINKYKGRADPTSKNIMNDLRAAKSDAESGIKHPLRRAAISSAVLGGIGALHGHNVRRSRSDIFKVRMAYTKWKKGLEARVHQATGYAPGGPAPRSKPGKGVFDAEYTVVPQPTDLAKLSANWDAVFKFAPLIGATVGAASGIGLQKLLANKARVQFMEDAVARAKVEQEHSPSYQEKLLLAAAEQSLAKAQAVRAHPIASAAQAGLLGATIGGALGSTAQLGREAYRFSKVIKALVKLEQRMQGAA